MNAKKTLTQRLLDSVAPKYELPEPCRHIGKRLYVAHILIKTGKNRKQHCVGL